MAFFVWVEWLGHLAQRYPGRILLAFGALVLIGFILRAILGKGQQQRPTTHGSAHWATKAQVRRAGMFHRHGPILGWAWGQYLRDDSESHILLVGATRSGKGLLLNATLLALGEAYSVQVTDPKDGENYDISHQWRARFGPVWAFAPLRDRGTLTRLNVLKSIHLGEQREFSDAYLIAQGHLAPEKMVRESQTSLHFRELAALLHAAVYLHVLYAWPRKSMAGVWEFMTQAHDSLASCLRSMARTRHHSAGVHQAIASMTRAIQNITGDRELSSVWSTAIRPLVPYSDPLVAANTDESDVDFDALQYGDRPVSLYLIAPSPWALEHLHPVFRAVDEVITARLMEHKVRTWRRRLLKVYDELPAYGYSRAVEKGIPVMAGYGIKSLLVVQDLEGLWDAYGQHTQVWGNVTVKVFQTLANDLTAKRVSENLLGYQTVENPIPQQSPVLGRARSVSLQHTGRELLKTDELMALPSHQQVVCVGGLPPILCDKVDYRVDPNFAGRWEAADGVATDQGA